MPPPDVVPSMIGRREVFDPIVGLDETVGIPNDAPT